MNLPTNKGRLNLLITIFFLVSCLTFLSCSEDKTEEVPAPKGKLKIVSLSPNVTEIIFALDAGDQLVGVTSFCDYPPEAQEVTKVGGVLDTNYEMILSLAPDVVVVLESQQQRAVELQELGLKTFVVANETLDDVYDSIIEVGDFLDKDEEATDLVSDMRGYMHAIQEKVVNLEKRSVAFVFEHGRGALVDIYIAGKGNFINELLEMAGGYNVFADIGRGYPQINMETFIKRDPDVIFDCTEEAGDPYESFPDLTAVCEGDVFYCFDDFIQKPGPRLVQSLEYLAKHLHPEAFED